MDNTVLTALIAGIAALGGAAIAGFSSNMSAKHKLRELEVTFSQKVRETYLQNAREYTKSIYVPLTLALSHLNDEYASFAANPDATGTVDRFKASIKSFLVEVHELRDRGAEAFLTNELEDKLRSFIEFLRESHDATAPVVKAQLGYKIGFGVFHIDETKYLKLVGPAALRWRSSRMTVNFAGMGVTYEANVLLAAPVSSMDFGTRFVADSGDLRFLVKEVTLGGRPMDESKK